MSKTLKFSNGDMVRMNANNGYELVNGKDKVKQDIELMLTTDIRSTTGLGCGLDEIVGSDTMKDVSAYSLLPVVFDFQTQVRSGMGRLVSAQRAYQFIERTNDELLYEVPPVSVVPSRDDFRTFTWSLTAITESGLSFSVNGSSG
jgi:hypothetical protein